MFEMRKEDGNFRVPMLPIPQEVLPGCFARAIPLITNGISIFIWEFTKDVTFPKHTHDSDEHFYLMRGEIIIYDENKNFLFTVNESNKYALMQKGITHIGFVKKNTVAITMYNPAMYFDNMK
jgi:hypothetical protein